jgi:HlyD family secretion protein
MRRWIIFLLVVILLGVGGYFGFERLRQQQQAAAISSLQTTPAGRGSLTATVGATGTVRANQSAVLSWLTSGTVEQINVKVGDEVTGDQVLATLSQTSLPQAVILAHSDLINAQKALDDLTPTELSISKAEQAVANAQKAVDDAQARVDSLSRSAAQSDIDVAQATVLLAKIQLDRAWDQYKPYQDKPEDNPQRATYYNAWAQAKKQYDAAVTRLNNLLGNANSTTLSIAESNLAVAKAQLEDAQKKLADLKAGPDPDDVTAARNRIAAAQATINMARIAAPFAGTITDVGQKPGDQVSPGVMAFRLDDLSRLLVDVSISEVDINRIAIGQDVVLTFDAIPNKEYHGRISEVALAGTSLQGVVDFSVTVELSDADAAVKTGMTAAVNVVVNQLEDVLLVPNRAVRVVDGQRVVYVLKDNQPVTVKIELGASSATVSEVVSGDLKEGDAIVLNPPVQFETNGPPPFARNQP